MFYFTIQAHQKNRTLKTIFSGEKKSKEQRSIDINIFCTYIDDDHMNSKIIKK